MNQPADNLPPLSLPPIRYCPACGKRPVVDGVTQCDICEGLTNRAMRQQADVAGDNSGRAMTRPSQAKEDDRGRRLGCGY